MNDDKLPSEGGYKLPSQGQQCREEYNLLKRYVSDGTESNEGSNSSPNPPNSADQCEETGSTAGSTDESAAKENNEECPKCTELKRQSGEYQ